MPSAASASRSTSSGGQGALWLRLPVGIDATRPYGVEFPKVSEVPGWHDFDLPEINES